MYLNEFRHTLLFKVKIKTRYNSFFAFRMCVKKLVWIKIMDSGC